MRYIAIEEKQIKQLKREAQQYQDDITCAVGTDFMQKIAEAENKTIFEIIKTIENAPTEDVVPRAEVKQVIKEFVKRFEYYIGNCTFTMGQTNDIQYALKKATEETQKKYIGE